MKSYFYFILVIFLLITLSSCNTTDKENKKPSELKAYLENWANNIIIPAYEHYQSSVDQLVVSVQSFDDQKTEVNFNKVKTDWLAAYKALQPILLFDFSHADNAYLTAMANLYPTDTQAINNNILRIANGEEINLSPNSFQERQVYQGFPALDYLLFEQTHTLDYYNTNNGQFASVYMLKLVQALKKNIGLVIVDWEQHKNTYISDSDNSVTGSYSATINAFIRGYEKDIRAEKVGYAAGAINSQSGNPAPQVIEAYYNAEISKELLTIALHSSRDFFNGKHFRSEEIGASLASALKKANKEDLVNEINEQYDIIDSELASISVTLKDLAINDNDKMRALYNAIQINVANYKTQMISALSVEIGYRDTDGD